MGAMLDFIDLLPWYAWVAIIAILAAAFQKIVHSLHQHEERMAMIKQGLDPDRPALADPEHDPELIES